MNPADVYDERVMSERYERAAAANHRILFRFAEYPGMVQVCSCGAPIWTHTDSQLDTDFKAHVSEHAKSMRVAVESAKQFASIGTSAAKPEKEAAP